MSMEPLSALIVNLEKHLGRELSPSERHLMLLAEELFAADRAADTEAQANRAGT
jgi:hypothetical protein